MKKEAAYFSPSSGGRAEAISDFIATPSNRYAENLARGNETLGLTTRLPDGSVSLYYNDLIITVAQEKTLESLRQSTNKALDILGARIQAIPVVDRESGTKSIKYIASISTRDCAEALNIKDKKRVKEILKEAAAFACYARLTYDSARIPAKEMKGYAKRGIEAFGGALSIADDWELSTSGVFTLIYSEKYAKLALAYPPMLYHRELARINEKKHPASYYLGHRLLEQINQKRKDAKEHKLTFTPYVTLSVHSLIHSASKVIPTPEKVAAEKRNRNYARRIIAPLERDLDALAEIGSWGYYRSAKDGGAAVSRAEAHALPFASWAELMVRFTFKGYLEEIKRREAMREAADRLALSLSAEEAGV